MINEAAAMPVSAVAARAPWVDPVAGSSGRADSVAVAVWRTGSVTASGWAIMATWEESISTVGEPARLASKRSWSGLMVLSCFATRNDEETG
ncbi:hypothetical protein [Streptomyces decoyicus]